MKAHRVVIALFVAVIAVTFVAQPVRADQASLRAALDHLRQARTELEKSDHDKDGRRDAAIRLTADAIVATERAMTGDAMKSARPAVDETKLKSEAESKGTKSAGTNDTKSKDEQAAKGAKAVGTNNTKPKDEQQVTKGAKPVVDEKKTTKPVDPIPNASYPTQKDCERITNKPCKEIRGLWLPAK